MKTRLNTLLIVWKLENGIVQSKEEQFESYCVKLLMDDVAPSLFRVTTMLVEVRKQLNSYSKSIGMSDDVNSDVPLEFVNSICRVRRYT